MQFEVRYNSANGVVYINKKGDRDYNRLKEFPYDKDGGHPALRKASEEARRYMEEHADALAEEWEKVKARENVRKEDVRREANRDDPNLTAETIVINAVDGTVVHEKAGY